MKFEMSVKVFPNGKLEIHLAILSVFTKGKEVNQRAQTNMGDQNKGIEKNL